MNGDALAIRLFVINYTKSKIWTASEIVKEVGYINIHSDSTSYSERKIWKVWKPSFDYPTVLKNQHVHKKTQ